MSETARPIIGFDLDGTLVDSNRDLCPAINHALQTNGRPPIERDLTRGLIGGGSALMLRRAFDLTGGALPDDAFETAHRDMLSFYEAHIADNTVPFDGCLSALDALAAEGFTLAVVSNKIERYSQLLIDKLGMTARFALILGGDSLGPGRSKPKPDLLLEARRHLGGGPMIYVGDSSYDVRAAKAAEVPVVLCSFGYNDAPAVELGADRIIDGFAELPDAVASLVRRSAALSRPA